jgi:uncharacterized protein (TIGR02444 family)
MSQTPMFSKSSLWQFSCDFYRDPAVERDCLTLQDDYDLNISLVLFLLWYSAVSGRILSSEQIEQLLLSIDKPQQWVAEYRAFRKHLWSKITASSASPNPDIKQALVNAELELEKVVVDALFESAQSTLHPPISGPAVAVNAIELEFVAHENLDAYISLFYSAPSDDLRRLLQSLLGRLLQLTQSQQAA